MSTEKFSVKAGLQSLYTLSDQDYLYVSFKVKEGLQAKLNGTSFQSGCYFYSALFARKFYYVQRRVSFLCGFNLVWLAKTF